MCIAITNYEIEFLKFSQSYDEDVLANSKMNESNQVCKHAHA